MGHRITSSAFGARELVPCVGGLVGTQGGSAWLGFNTIGAGDSLGGSTGKVKGYMAQ